MKTKFRRILSVILTLCMMFGMLPAGTVTAEASTENVTYELEVDFPYNSNNLLPNSTKEADVYLNLRYPDDSGYRMESGYTIEMASIAKESAADPEPTELINVQMNGGKLVMTSNANDVTGSCVITLEATVDGKTVATKAYTINVENEIYEIPDVLKDPNNNNNVVNPDICEVLDLESLLVLKKLTYNHTDNSVTSETMKLDDSKYTVTIDYPTDRWTKTDVNDTTGAYNLTRITAENAWFIVSIEEENVGCLASNSYEFDSLSYDASWARDNVAFEVYKDDTANFYLNINMPGKDYAVTYTLGYGPWNDNNVLSNSDKALYTTFTDTNGKVTGICVDGEAISQVRQGNDFWIKAEASVIISGTPYKVSEDYIELQLLEPDYSVQFMNNNYSIFNTDTEMNMYLVTQNIQNKAYDIDFILGNWNPTDGFVPFDDDIQDELFTEITDANNGNKVVGLCLNGAAISSVCNNSQFEVNVKVIIDDEVKYTWNQSVILNRTNFWLNIIWNGNWPIRVYDDATAAQLELDTSSLSNLSDYELDFELGTMGQTGPDSYAPFSTQTGLFSKVVDSNTGKVTGISLNGVAIRQVCSGDEFVIKVDTKLDGYTISTNHLGVCLFSTEPSYHYNYGDENVLPGDGKGIDPQIEYEIQNSQNPDGVLGKVDVTDVSVQVTDGASDAVIVKKDGNMWNIICNSLGKADVTITHKTPDGGTETYTYTLSVVDSVWETRYWNRDGLYNAVQGGSISIDAVIKNERWAQNTGKYLADTPYEVVWFVENPDQAQYLTFVYNNADKTDVTIEVASNAPEEDYNFGYFVYELDSNGNRITNGTGNAYPVCGSGGRLVVMNDFPYLYLDGYTRDLEVGESITVTPSAIRRYLDNGVVKEEELEDAIYSFWNDPESVEILDNQDGTFKITRLKGWEINDCGFGVEAAYLGGPFRTEERMYFLEIELWHNFVDGVCTECGALDLQPSVESTDSILDGTLAEEVVADTETLDKIEETKQDSSKNLVEEVIMNSVSEESVPTQEVEDIGEKFEAIVVAEENVEGSGIVQYLDISYLAKAQDKADPDKVEVLGELIEVPVERKIKICIPEALQKLGRTFFVIRHHIKLDGSVEVEKLDLKQVSKEEFVFYTNKFSTYALAYVDVHVHTETIINAEGSNCGTDGYTGDVVCSTCNEVIQKGSVIKADGNHNWSEWKNQEGIAYTLRECWGCGGSEYLNADATVNASKVDTSITSVGIPATGDNSNAGVWVTMIALTCVCMAYIAFSGKKRYNK